MAPTREVLVWRVGRFVGRGPFRRLASDCQLAVPGRQARPNGDPCPGASVQGSWGVGMNRSVLGGFAVALSVATVWAAPLAQASPAISVAQHGAAAPWRGTYYWVYFPGTGHLSGSVSGVAAGTAVTLQASAFPFTHGYSRLDRTTTASSGSFSFAVHPSKATRYRIASAGATSRVLTFYVLSRGKSLGQSLCQPGASTCHASASYANWLPASVGPREAAQKLYFYLGITRGSHSIPTTLYRRTNFTVHIQRASTTKWVSNLHFTFYAGTGPWEVVWVTCTRQIESTDGFGLPVHTGCGSSSVPNNQPRLQVLG